MAHGVLPHTFLHSLNSHVQLHYTAASSVVEVQCMLRVQCNTLQDILVSNASAVGVIATAFAHSFHELGHVSMRTL